MRVRRVTRGPLFADGGPLGARLQRRAKGVAIETGALVALTLVFPLALGVAAVVDLALWIVRRKPWMAVRLTCMAWWFLFGELRGVAGLAAIYLVTGGPLGRRSLWRRRLVYDLRIHWARSHLGGIRVLFGLTFEVEGLEDAGPGPVLILMRHASIIDNAVPDAVIGHAHGLGLRFVLKHEMQMLPTIDIGGRWVPTTFVRRASPDSAGEVARLRPLAHDLGEGEGILIYPEGTRHTPEKLARAQEVIAERQPKIAHLAGRLRNVLPPRLGGPLALLDEADRADVVICGHVGLDGFEHISDIWTGGLVGTTVRLRFWRHPAAEVPTGEDERVAWLYERWQVLDDWVGEQRRSAAR
ncbi:MAG: 1-acyl-sn-glycerol-3-phosphate acyltransferase [Thermoleophilaceae bacterium]